MASIGFDRLDQAGARAFLDALAHDEDYRGRLLQDPQSALAEHNITIDDDALPHDVELELPPRHLAAWALHTIFQPETENKYPSPAIIETNPMIFASCTLWGITLAVAARAK